MQSYQVTAERVDAHGSIARCKQAEVVLDTDLAGRDDALNPAELLLAAVAACILKNIERIGPIIDFSYRGVRVDVTGKRQEKPPKLVRIEYAIVVDTDEPDRKLELMHRNIRDYGTVYNTVAPGTELTGSLIRAAVAASD